MKKTICLIIGTLIMCIFCINKVFAYTDVQVNLSSDKNTAKDGEEIELILSLENAKTAAFTSYIYFDNSYFEYVKGPKMSNLDNNHIIYVWYDENGVGDSKDGELARFTFRAKKDGSTSFNVNGEFFDEDGDLIDVNFNDVEISIEELIEDSAENVKSVSEDVDDNSNTNLETLSVENMLLYPKFDNNVTSYNFEVPNDVVNLNILAIPENEKAIVQVNGGTDLKEGDNRININVIAENGNTKKVFSLNAYRRNQSEEKVYLKDQEENKEKLEEIYNTQKSIDVVEVNDNREETVLENLKNPGVQESNLWTFVVIGIGIGIILVVIIIVFGYKHSKKSN